MDINQKNKIYWLNYQREHKLFIYNILKIKGAVTMATVVNLTCMLTRDTCYLYLTIKTRIALFV